jgi:broad specificity phosphatase PhoE
LTSLAGLGERRFGKFEGRLTSDPQTGPEYERRRWIPDDSLDGGESLNVFAVRVRGVMETVRARHTSGAILIVGHGHTNQLVLKMLFNLTIDQTRSIMQANDELYLIELQAGTTPRLWKLITEASLKDL